MLMEENLHPYRIITDSELSKENEDKMCEEKNKYRYG